MDPVSIDGITCPKCGQNCFNAELAEKKLYMCKAKDEDGYTCGHILAYCKTCGKIQDESEFGQHGDVWECKECGTICWPLTDRKRSEASAREKFRKMNSDLDNLIKHFNF